MRYSTGTVLGYGEDGSRGFAIRFVLSEDGHTHHDIMNDNAYGFVVSTGEGFLDLFEAIRDSKLEEFLEKYPHAKYFNEHQAPAHSYSFATEQWHSIQAFKFVNTEGQKMYFRWRIVPRQGVMKHNKADAAKQSKNYQFEDLEYRLTRNKPIKSRLMAQLAGDGDEVNETTKVGPETIEFVEMGETVVDRLWTMDKEIQQGKYRRRLSTTRSKDT